MPMRPTEATTSAIIRRVVIATPSFRIPRRPAPIGTDRWVSWLKSARSRR